MKESNLNILVIQNHPEDIDKALNKIKKNATNILFRNISSKLKLGERTVKIEFDKALYSDENNLLILIMRSSSITYEELVRRLDEKNLDFSEIVFENYEFADYDEELKDIYFAKDSSSLKSALYDSKKKGNDVCRYNPIMKGKLTLKYPGRIYLDSECEEIETKIVLNRQMLRGIIETEDKIIFLINNLEEHNVYYKQVLKIISSLGMTPIIEDYETFNQKEKAKQKVKVNKEINESGQA